MKILVPCKRVPDTDAKIRLHPAGDRIDDTDVPYIINPFDAIALEEAIRLRETGSLDPVEIIAVGIGSDEYEKELRTAMAMGADRALLVATAPPLDPWNVAKLLHAIVSRELPDLVLMGKQAVDDDANQTGQFLAAQLGWPQATFVSHLDATPWPRLRVARETDAGIETLSLATPAVITADLRLNEPRYASLPSIMKARKKPIERLTAAELGISPEPRVRVVQLQSIGSARACVQIHSATELIDKLRHEAKVL